MPGQILTGKDKMKNIPTACDGKVVQCGPALPLGPHIVCFLNLDLPATE
jgi:hypothetical protein